MHSSGSCGTEVSEINNIDIKNNETEENLKEEVKTVTVGNTTSTDSLNALVVQTTTNTNNNNDDDNKIDAESDVEKETEKVDTTKEEKQKKIVKTTSQQNITKIDKTKFKIIEERTTPKASTTTSTTTRTLDTTTTKIEALQPLNKMAGSKSSSSSSSSRRNGNKKRSKRLKVHVRTHMGKTVTVNARYTDTVSKLKDRIQNAMGIDSKSFSLSFSSAYQQQLTFTADGKIDTKALVNRPKPTEITMTDRCTMVDYGFSSRDEITVTLLPSVRSGPMKRLETTETVEGEDLYALLSVHLSESQVEQLLSEAARKQSVSFVVSVGGKQLLVRVRATAQQQQQAQAKSKKVTATLSSKVTEEKKKFVLPETPVNENGCGDHSNSCKRCKRYKNTQASHQERLASFRALRQKRTTPKATTTTSASSTTTETTATATPTPTPIKNTTTSNCPNKLTKTAENVLVANSENNLGNSKNFKSGTFVNGKFQNVGAASEKSASKKKTELDEVWKSSPSSPVQVPFTDNKEKQSTTKLDKPEPQRKGAEWRKEKLEEHANTRTSMEELKEQMRLKKEARAAARAALKARK
eukprot:Pgem_evm1s16574